MAVFETVFDDRQVAVDIVDAEGNTDETVTIRLAGGMLEPVPPSEASPAFHVKLQRNYMEHVVEHRRKYVDHPDWDWLKTRLGAELGQSGRDGPTSHKSGVRRETDDNGAGSVESRRITTERNVPTMKTAAPELLNGLNEAFNREITTAIRYLLQGSTIQGLQNEPLRQMYRSEMSDELRHAQYLADKIVMLGGVPRLHAEVTTPPDHVNEMMEKDLAAEENDVRQ